MTEYWESYRFSLLLHNLNMYFGSKKFAQSDINDLINEYIVHMKTNYNIDYVYEERNMNTIDFLPITSYIASKTDKLYYYVTHSPKDHNNLFDDVKCFFVYTNRTMYVMKLINKTWFKYDALTGIYKSDLAQVLSSPKNMFIVPLKSLDKYLEYTTKDLKNFLIANKVTDGASFVENYEKILETYMILLTKYYLARKRQNENQSLDLPISLYYNYNTSIIKNSERLLKDNMDINDKLKTVQYYMINYLKKKYIIG